MNKAAVGDPGSLSSVQQQVIDRQTRGRKCFLIKN
jgi:hypothetical protein